MCVCVFVEGEREYKAYKIHIMCCYGPKLLQRWKQQGRCLFSRSNFNVVWQECLHITTTQLAMFSYAEPSYRTRTREERTFATLATRQWRISLFINTHLRSHTKLLSIRTAFTSELCGCDCTVVVSMLDHCSTGLGSVPVTTKNITWLSDDHFLLSRESWCIQSWNSWWACVVDHQH